MLSTVPRTRLLVSLFFCAVAALLLFLPDIAHARPRRRARPGPARGADGRPAGRARSRAAARSPAKAARSRSAADPAADEPADGAAVDLLMMTSFTRIIIVLSILRQAIGLQQTPPNQVLVGLSLFLSLFVMRPVIEQVNATAITPYGAGQISIEEAISRCGTVLHGFMIRQTRETDLRCSPSMAGAERFASRRGRALLDPAAGLRHQRAEDRLPDRLPDLPALPDHRPRRLLDPDVARHDDAVADDRLDAVQAVAVRAGRRLGADDGLARRLLRGG